MAIKKTIKNEKHQVIHPITDVEAVEGLNEALVQKQDVLNSGVNIKTINGETILGSGNITISGGGSTISVDTEMSETSENPVQNKVITQAISDFITKSVDDLINYYRKAEVDSLISAVSQFSYEVVTALPTASASTMYKIYLVPSSEPEAQNVKDEYITIRSGVEGSYTYSWEQIGSTAIDLSNYVTVSALNSALASYTTTAQLTTLLAAKQDIISDLSTIRSGATAGATAYQKPSGGVPKLDLASSVQTSLGKADTAIQPAEFNELEEEVETIGNGAYEEAWDGDSTPVVADIPAGVVVTYSSASYTGTLAASASTVDKIYLVSDGNGNYDRYVTIENSGTYSWKKVGTTAIPLSDYATKAEFSQLEAEVNGVDGFITPISDITKCQVTASGTNTRITVTTNGNYCVKFYKVRPGATYIINVADARGQRAWGWCDTYLSSTPESNTDVGGLVSTDTTTAGEPYSATIKNTGNYEYLAVAYKYNTAVSCNEKILAKVVGYVPQSNDDEERAIARQNIGAASKNEVDEIVSDIDYMNEVNETPLAHQTKAGVIAGSSQYAINNNMATDYAFVKAGRIVRVVSGGGNYVAFSLTPPANGVSTINYQSFNTTSAMRAATFVYAESDAYIGVSRSASSDEASFVIVPNGLAAKIENITPSLGGAKVQFPKFLYASYNGANKFRNIVQSVKIEGVIDRPIAGLGLNNGRAFNFSAQGTVTGVTKENKAISVTMAGKSLSDTAFKLVVTNLNAISGKSIKHLAIGDSWTSANEARLDGEVIGPWGYVSTIYDLWKKATIDLNDQTSKFISIGRAAAQRRNGMYGDITYQIRSSSEGFGGWSSASILRHPFSIRTEGNGTMSEKLAWDAMGLGRKQVYGQNYDETAPYTQYVPGIEHRKEYLSTAMGYYHWDYSTELLNYAGVSGSYTGSEEQKAAIDNAMTNLLNSPVNPFFDWDVARSTGGSYAFSIAKYLERYKTLAADGTTRLVVGDTAGTLITSSTINSYDILAPNFVTIEFGTNDYPGFSAQERVNDLISIAEAIHDYDAGINVGIINARTPGYFDPAAWQDRISADRIKDNIVDYYFKAESSLRGMNAVLTETFSSEDGDGNVFYIPTYFIQGATQDGAYLAETPHGEKILIDGTDYVHPAINVYEEIGTQVFDWILYMLT